MTDARESTPEIEAQAAALRAAIARLCCVWVGWPVVTETDDWFVLAVPKRNDKPIPAWLRRSP